ncbi:hypothetical protein ACRYCC_37815 [Actinomadura scrupuli]|uniref:hypothetical protein n=1 Tax=Actinomadura scrupuli TaxID=559629 RepID=UPI003D96CBA9
MVSGPFTTGVPIPLTLSPGTGSTPVSYRYQVNDGAPATAMAAVDGTAKITVTPTGRAGTLSVTGIAADGTASTATVERFRADAAQPAATQDINGDGIPDLVTTGGTPGLPSGMWLVPGTGDGRGGLRLPAKNIGALGAGFNTDAAPSDFDGGQVITGYYYGDGFQDFLFYVPSGTYRGRGSLLSGSGDGSVVDPIAGNFSASGDYLADSNGDWPLQLANAYNAEGVPGHLDDLITITGSDQNGYHLTYFESRATDILLLGAPQLTITANTPDGTADWQNWTLATTKTASGTAMYLRKQSTGQLYLWDGFTVKNNGDSTGSISYKQYAISAKWNKGTTLSTLEAADFGSEDAPGLWTVTPDGRVRTYVVSGLKTNPKIKLVHRAQLG